MTEINGFIIELLPTGPALHAEMMALMSVNRNSTGGNYKTGRYTCEAIQPRRHINAWIGTTGKIAQEVE